MRKIYLTETQFSYILEHQMLHEGVLQNLWRKIFGKCKTKRDILNRVLVLISSGIFTFGVAINLINLSRDTILTNELANELVIEISEQAPQEEWRKVCDDAVVTVYNAEPEQCNKDVEHTASMFHLNLSDVASHRIVALERTFMKELGLKFGDIIKIEGTHRGLQDGVYQVQDVMNKRYAGEHRVDVMVPNEITRGGTWPGTYAKIYVLNDKSNTQSYLDLMAPEKPKQ